MRKKLISLMLVAAFVVGMIPLFARADTGTAEKGEYTYTLSSDPDTGTVPAGFGTISNNGRIWTDKSVNVNDDHFDVNLKVLAQEYISSFGTTETQSIAADVLFILDFTTSMYNNRDVEKDDGTSVSRLSAMVDAANEAIDIITQTNPNNRIKVFRFSGSSSNCNQYSKEIMPLAHYTSSSTSTETKDKYIRLSGTQAVASSSTLLKDGESFTFNETAHSGTCTQYGIAAGVKSFVDDINAETDNSVERRPYVIMLTDGEPTLASKNWNSEDVADLRTNTITTSSGGDRYELMATGAILSAAIWRDRLADAYEVYNSNGKEIDVQWFNIGLGVDEPTDPDNPNYTACLLNPYYMVGVTGTNQNATSREKIKYYMAQPDWGPKVTEKNYALDGNYTYINEGDGYVTFANTYSVLMNAFVTLANIIKMGSMEYTIPIVNHEGSGETSSDVVFTDVIGEGMYITDITLKQNGRAPVTAADDDGDGTYNFSGYSTAVTITEDQNGQQTLVWSIPANEVAMFTFADREDVGNGEYIPAEPTTLTYGVDFTNDIEEGPAYTNAFDQNMVPLTTVSYEIPGDNDYYFDVVKDELHNFVSSTMKTGLDGYTQKTDNVTSTAPDSHSYAYTAQNDGTENSSATVNGLLGNNGKASFLSRKENMEITLVKIWEDKNGTVITDTSALPAVTVTLYRKADDSNVEETAQVAQLSNANDYTQTYTVPIRDPNDKRYTYYIRENCPDGYFIAEVSDSLRAHDGTLSVTNRALPDEGTVVVQKQWQNKLGGAITDMSSLPPVEMKLRRHVTAYTPDVHTVTVKVTDNAGRGNTYTLPVKTVYTGSTISFKLRVYIRRQNATNSATISLNNQTITSTASQQYYYIDPDDPDSGRISNDRYWCRETVIQPASQPYTVTDNVTFNYVCSTNLNTNTITGYDPVQLIDFTVTPPANPGGETEYYDEDYETVTLCNDNHWQNIFEGLTLEETVSGTEYTYKYFVEETGDIPGFEAFYSDNNTEGVTGGVITVTNRSTTAIGPLPETGGRGNPDSIRIVGFSAVFLSMAVFLFRMYLPVYKKRRKSLN